VQAVEAGDRQPGSPEGRVGPQAIAPAPEALDAALERLAAARRPVIIVGHGARFDMEAVTALAERLRCPVLTTFKGKGLISDHHPLGCGVLGRSGTPIASHFMNESDLLLVLGASFSNHTGITPKKPTIQVDYERTALGRFHPVDVPVWGEIGRTVDLLRERLPEDAAAQDHRREIAERWEIWRSEKARRRGDDRGHGLNSAAVFQVLQEAAPGDAVMCVDVGNNAYSFGRYFEATGHSFLMSGYLGSIGFALPAALGAWVATREEGTPFHGRKVVSVSGDGGFAQYMGEFNTLVLHDMNVTHVVLNDAELGKISKEQRGGNWDVWKTKLTNPSFADYADSCGGLGIRVTDPDELPGALARAIEHEGPSLVEIMTDSRLI
jgi:thiamine pyrophosphate-dependent acetolactate synthase large subunit-like protein